MRSFGSVIIAVLVLSLFVLTSCSSISYLSQSISGQLEVLNKRAPIQEMLDDPATSVALRRKLKLVLDARNFASTALHLPENDSYRSYSDLQRRYVVWNVFAAPEFSLKPKQWCFLVVGCLSYRGYFANEDAQTFAGELRKQGYDVYVGGVPAYSTLGWFDDPVMNTMLDWEDSDIAGLVFHELTHQLVYVKDDSGFNESFATAVELEGVRRWMDSSGTVGQHRSYVAGKKRQQEFVAMVMNTRNKITGVYNSSMSEQQKRQAKEQVFNTMRSEYQTLKINWHGYAGYDRWMSRELNNAKLASVVTYHQYVPAFMRLLQKNHGDLQLFYAEVSKLAELSKHERDQFLLQLTDDSVE